MDPVRVNLTEEVSRHLAEFRDDVDQALTGAISNVDETLRQLESQAEQEGLRRRQPGRAAAQTARGPGASRPRALPCSWAPSSYAATPSSGLTDFQ